MYIWINFVFKLNLIIYIFARATYSGVSCAKTIVLATATRKSCVLPRAKLDFCFANRAENLRYQFEQGQELLPQLRQIICLVKVGRDTHTRYYGCGKFQPIRSVLIYAMCLFEDGIGVARRRPVARASLRSRQSPYVIPRSETTWESPKSKQKPFYDCHKPHSPSRLLPRREFALSVQTRAKTPATISPNYLLGESWAGHPHPIYYGCGRFRPIRSVLIYAMCLFEDGTRAATAARKANAELDV